MGVAVETAVREDMCVDSIPRSRVPGVELYYSVGGTKC